MKPEQRHIVEQLVVRNCYVLAIRYSFLQNKINHLLERRIRIQERGFATDASRSEIIQLLRADRLAGKYFRKMKRLDSKIQNVWSKK